MIKTLALLAALASPLPAFAQVTEDTLCSVATKESIIAPEQTAQAIVESWLHASPVFTHTHQIQ
jgi:hypothetical protein